MSNTFKYPVPTNPPNSGDFVIIGFNREWLPIILSAINALDWKNTWDNPPDDILEQVQELIYLFSVDLDP